MLITSLNYCGAELTSRFQYTSLSWLFSTSITVEPLIFSYYTTQLYNNYVSHLNGSSNLLFISYLMNRGRSVAHVLQRCVGDWYCVHTAAGESVNIRPGRPTSNAVERFVDALTLWRRSNDCHVFKGAAKQTSTLILCRLTTSRV